MRAQIGALKRINKKLFQDAGENVHLGHGEAHHIGVGVLNFKRRRNSSRF